MGEQATTVFSTREVTAIYTTHEIMPEQTRTAGFYSKEVTDLYTRHKILLEQATTDSKALYQLSYRSLSTTDGTRTRDLSIISGSNRYLRQARDSLYTHFVWVANLVA